jgi:predicted dehydrogenase
MAKITMLGTGLIGTFYTQTLHGLRSRDRVVNVYSQSAERARAFAAERGIPRWSADMREAVRDPESEIVVIGLPNNIHREAVFLAIEAKKAVLCTKPLGRTAAEAREMLEAVEKAGVFAGYLEDLVYTPKTLKSLESVRKGALGRILWTRSRETHPGPHSAWFWDPEQSGGGAVVDMGCHCIEIGRNFIGKDRRPLRAFCWGATQVHPISAEDHAIGLVEYEGGAVSQFEVSWTFRGTRSPGRKGRSASIIFYAPASRCSRPWARAGMLRKRPRGSRAGSSPSGMRPTNSATSTCSRICSTRAKRDEPPWKLSTTGMW